MHAEDILEDFRQFIEHSCDYYDFETFIGDVEIPGDVVGHHKAGLPFLFLHAQTIDNCLMGDGKGWLDGLYVKHDSEALCKVSVDIHDEEACYGARYPLFSFMLESLKHAHEMTPGDKLVNLNSLFQHEWRLIDALSIPNRAKVFKAERRESPTT